MAEHPKVFISYSHDSPVHKQWVSELGAKLRRNGVDAILDQWDLGPGDDLTLFMERGIRDSDRVLVICTDSYVRKADAGEGGVGYERMIVTAQLVQDLGTDKFIPIIRQASGQKKMPTCLETRVYTDFRDESQFDEEFAKLLHELHQVPVVEKPPLGKSPFAQTSSGQEVLPSEGLNTQLPDSPDPVESESYANPAAFEVTGAGNIRGWHQHIERIQRNTFNTLVQWQQDELNGRQIESTEKLTEVVDKAVEIISHLISTVLMWGEANKRELKDQESILYDLLNIPEWNRAGDEFWADIPNALGYVYHSLHGSFCLSIYQLDLALNLARTEIPIPGQTKTFPVWDSRELMGWARSLGPNCIEGWKYLAKAYKKWEWLSSIFVDESEYLTSLVAYYMALHIHELASIIASGKQDTLNTSSRHFKVPLNFFAEGRDINERAVHLLRRNPEAFRELWTSLNVTHEQMEYAWEDWIQLYEDWFFSVYRSSFNTKTHLPKLFRDLFSS